MRGEELKIARSLLAYPEDSIGRLMTPEYVSVRADWEIRDVLDHIRKQPPAESRLALDEPPPAGDGGGRLPSFAGIGGRRSHEPDADELYEEAVRIVLGSRRGSVSLLQRRLGIGYTRAGKLIDMMAAEGLIGPNATQAPVS